MAERDPSVFRDALGDCWAICAGKLRRRADREAQQRSACNQDLECRDDDDAHQLMQKACTENGDAAALEEIRESVPNSLTPAQRRDVKIHAQNVMVIMVALTHVLTAFFGLQFLESSINASGGLGQTCVSLVYFPSVLSVTLLSPFLLRRIGPQRLVQVSMVPFIVFTAAHFRVVPAVFLPMCGLLGVFNMMLGTSITVLMACAAIDYAALYGIEPDRVMPRFSSMLYMGLVSAYVTGPIISSLVLHNPGLVGGDNGTRSDGECRNADEVLPLPDKERYVLLSVYMAVGMMGVLISCRLRTASTTSIKAKLASSTTFQQITATMRLVGNLDLVLLIPIFFGSGMLKEVFASNYTSFFVTPCLGVASIGYGTSIFGAANFLTTVLLPLVMKRVNKAALVVMATMMHTTVMLTLMLWRRHANAGLLFSLAVMWGVAEAMWNISTCVMVAIVFPREQEAAMSNFRVWQGLGFALSATYSNRIGGCLHEMRVKFAYTICYCWLAVVAYGLLEWRQRHQKNAIPARKQQAMELVPLEEQS